MSASELRILAYPDPALRLRASEVRDVDDEVRAVASRMLELMVEADGVGLAATQVGLPWRLFVAHVRPAEDDPPVESDLLTSTDQPIVCVNPILSRFEGAPEICEEGCLSLPEIRGDVPRSPVVSLDALDLESHPFSIRCGGLLARCVQHETDHLEGVLIIDKMTQMSRLKNRSSIRDLERRAKDL